MYYVTANILTIVNLELSLIYEFVITTSIKANTDFFVGSWLSLLHIIKQISM